MSFLTSGVAVAVKANHLTFLEIFVSEEVIFR